MLTKAEQDGCPEELNATPSNKTRMSEGRFWKRQLPLGHTDLGWSHSEGNRDLTAARSLQLGPAGKQEALLPVSIEATHTYHLCC
jgi:hypothetical protein